MIILAHRMAHRAYCGLIPLPPQFLCISPELKCFPLVCLASFPLWSSYLLAKSMQAFSQWFPKSAFADRAGISSACRFLIWRKIHRSTCAASRLVQNSMRWYEFSTLIQLLMFEGGYILPVHQNIIPLLLYIDLTRKGLLIDDVSPHRES